MTNLDFILKSKGIILPTKVHMVKAMVFLVAMYRCESWTKKKANHQRIDFELWCWRILLRVSWTARRSNQSILEKINPEYSLEGLTLKLKLQYIGHLMLRADSLEKDPDAGKNWRQKKRTAEDEMVKQLSPTQWTWVWANSGKTVKDWRAAVHGVTKSWTWLSNWTTTTKLVFILRLKQLKGTRK